MSELERLLSHLRETWQINKINNDNWNQAFERYKTAREARSEAMSKSDGAYYELSDIASEETDVSVVKAEIAKYKETLKNYENAKRELEEAESELNSWKKKGDLSLNEYHKVLDLFYKFVGTK